MAAQTRYHGHPVYIVDGCRTPFLKARGVPGPFSAAELGVAAGRILLARHPIPLDALDQVILGCVAPGVDEANIARVVALRLGLDARTPAWTVQRNCASGMQAIDSAACDIVAGRSDLILAGGTEAMSHHPVLFGQAMVGWLGRWSRARTIAERGRLLAQWRPSYLAPVIALLKGLTDPVVGLSMGQTAEELAWRFHIEREAMDRFALRSHRLLGEARDAGVLDAEITPLFDHEGQVYDTDDGYRPHGTAEKLARLPAVFDRPHGLVTAGNSAQITDGAAMLLLASEQAVTSHGLPVLARVLDGQWAALEPAHMGLGPVHAIAPLLARNHLKATDLDHWEISEAFAAQVLACLAAWADPDYRRNSLKLSDPIDPIPEERLNPNGGAIALGHPVGASGARLVLHLARSLQHRDTEIGIASLCIGGGQGGAMLIAREGGPS